MSWSYTQPSGERYKASGNYYARWWNAWSVTELAPVSPNKIRLRVTLSTQGYGQNGSYVWSAADSLACGSASVAVRSYTVAAGVGYTADVEVPGSWSGQQIQLNIGWCSVRAALTATAALPSAITAEDGFFGEALAISLAPALSGARHRLTASCAGRTETLLDTDSGDTVLSWTPALSVYAPLLPNAASAAVTLSCETFYGGVSMGSTTKTVTLRFAEGSLAPQLSAGWCAASAYNSGAAAGLTGWIQGYSRAALSFDATKISCAYGASAASYSVRCEGLTVDESPWRTAVLSAATAALLCTVTDSRGQSASETLSITLQPYAQPALTGPEIFRCDAQGAATEDGSCLAVTVSAAISSLGGENSAALSAALRPLSGSFGAENALSSGQRTILSGLSPDTSYELRLRATDALGNTAEYRRTLPSRRWAMKFRADGNGVAFGKAAEQSAALELANSWALVLHGPNGETASLDYAALTALLDLI